MQFLKDIKNYSINKIKVILNYWPNLQSMDDSICVGTKDNKAIIMYVKYCYLNMYRKNPVTIMGHVIEVTDDYIQQDLSDVALESYPIEGFVIVPPEKSEECNDMQVYKDLEVLRNVQRIRMQNAQERK